MYSQLRVYVFYLEKESEQKKRTSHLVLLLVISLIIL